MSLILNEEQQLLAESAAKFFADNSPIARVRALRDEGGPIGFSPDVWNQMAQLGWLGIMLPEKHGGSAMGLSELGVVLMEAGRVLAPEPLLSALLLGANTLRLSESDGLKSELLPAVSRGDKLITLAFEEVGRFSPYEVEARAVEVDGGYALSGEKTHVIDGHAADHFVVLARITQEAEGREGLALFLIDADCPGVEVQSKNLIDARHVVQLTLNGAKVDAQAMLGNADLLDRVLDAATMGLVAEMIGMADEVFERTIAYLKDREQFGVKIGTFQALRHRAAEMFAELEFARTLMFDGLAAVDECRDDASLSVSAAKAQANKAGRLIAAEGVQMHGGMGMTDELDIGLFLKRLKAAELTFGDESYHHRRFASLRGY